MRKFHRMILAILLVLFMFVTLAYGEKKPKDIFGVWLVDIECDYFWKDNGYWITKIDGIVYAIEGDLVARYTPSKESYFELYRDTGQQTEVDIVDGYYHIIGYHVDLYLDLEENKKGLVGKGISKDGDEFYIHLIKKNLDVEYGTHYSIYP